MAASQVPAQPTALTAWEKLFYNGDRLRAEVLLHGAALAGDLQPSAFLAGSALIHSSHGLATVQEPISPFVAFQQRQNEPSTLEEAWQQLLPVADLPDALLFWALHRRLSALVVEKPDQRIRLLQRLAILLYVQWPGRPDLPYQVLLREVTGSLLFSAPKHGLKPGQCYSQTQPYLCNSKWLG